MIPTFKPCEAERINIGRVRYTTGMFPGTFKAACDRTVHRPAACRPHGVCWLLVLCWAGLIFDGPAMAQVRRRRPPDRFRTPVAPAASDPAADDTNRTDDRLITNTSAERGMRQVESYVEREKWPEVVAGLQSLVEAQTGSGDAFVRDADGRWASLQQAAERRIATLPEPGRRLYREVYGGVASQLLEQARRSGDIDRMADVARRFRHTSAGAEAATDLARIAFDRGEPLAAVRWFDRLPAESHHQRSAIDQLKFALALVAAGRLPEANAIIQKLEASSATVDAIPDQSLHNWWSQAAQTPLAAPTFTADWRQPYGNGEHNAPTETDPPVLTDVWQLPVTYVPAVRDQLIALAGDLRDAGRAPIPSRLPVVTERYAAVRTLRGVDVVDLPTGRLLWSSLPESAAPDRLLSGSFVGDEHNRSEQSLVAAQALYSLQESGNFDQHPLTSLLYQDAVDGTLTTDGRQLFVVSQNALLGRPNSRFWGGPQPSESDPFDRDWSSNVLTSYDLETGQVLWRVGGRQTGEPFDPPLAGVFFFGPPTVAGDELFAIGERGNEISLFILDSRSGLPKCTQPLATAESPISLDMARRAWACSPAVSNGIVVSSTTTGWTIAFDQRERRLLWAHDCQKPDRDNSRVNFSGVVLQPIHPLNTRWEYAPPIIMGRRVILTPVELPDAFHNSEPVVLCLELTTGRELWRIPKQEEGLFVGGVTSDLVIVVGQHRIRGLRIEDGTETWTATLSPDVSPSGRGVLATNSYRLPLSNGELWSLALSDGRIQERLEQSSGQRPLGNLVSSQGWLLSADALGLRAFKSQSTVESQIAVSRAADPHDVSATLQAAELARMRKQPELALELLTAGQAAIATLTENSDMAIAARRLRRDCLLTLVVSDFDRYDAEFEQLQQTAGADQDFELQRLAIERALHRRNAAAAWQLLWPPAVMPEPETVIKSGLLEVQRSAWESGRLQDVYGLADDSLRQTMDLQFAEAVERLLPLSTLTAEHWRLERRLSFHPQGDRLTSACAETAASANDFAGAEIRWRSLMARSASSQRWSAGLRLVEWLTKWEQLSDARQLFAEIEAAMASDPEDMPPLLADRLDEVREFLAHQPPASASELSDWADTPLQVSVQAHGGGENVPQIVPIAPGLADFYTSHLFEFDTQTQRLRIEDSDGAEFWSLPLRMQRRQLYDQTAGLRTNGLQAYSVWQGIIQALSLPDRQVRWSMPIDLRLSGSSYLRNVEWEQDAVLLPADQFLRQHSLERYRAPTGMAAAAAADYVLMHGRRAVSLLDALTGDVRWTRTGLPPQSMVYADGQSVAIYPADGSEPLLLHARDGRRQENAVLAQSAKQTLALRNRVLTVLRPPTGRSFLNLFTPRGKLSGVRLDDGQEFWSLAIDTRTRLGWLSADELLVIDGRRRVTSIQLASGETLNLGVLPGEAPYDDAPIQMLSDRDSVYLLFDRDWRRQSYFMTLPHLQINGWIVCLSRDGSGVRWHRRIQEQRLITSQFAQSPVLMFFNQVDDDELHRLEMEIWNKSTGRPLLTSEDLRIREQTFQLKQDFPHRTLKLLGHSAQVVIGPAAVAQSEADRQRDKTPAKDDQAGKLPEEQ
ncbi:MAG: PQQ-binding-like beta-propeller repeat protein [Planctomycetaceae bacterium]